MTRARVDLALVALFAAVLLAADATTPPLFTALAGSALVLAFLYTLVRPSLVRSAVAWTVARWRRAVPAGLIAIALFAAAGYAGDQVRHPVVDAAALAQDWTTANGALAKVMGGYVRWFDASSTERRTLIADMRASTRQLAESVDLLERVRPPEAELRTHLAVVAVYAEIVRELEALPDALANDDTTTAAGIVRYVSALADRASDYVRLATPPR